MKKQTPAARRQPATSGSVVLRRQAEERFGHSRALEGPPGGEEDPRRLVHELQVHQIELELQNEELRQARSEVERGLERYTTLYDFAPVGYFTLDADGKVRQANLSGARLLGVERARLVGARFGQFVAPDNRDIFQTFLEAVFTGQARGACEVEVLRENLSSLWVRIEADADVGGEESRLVVVDISEQKLLRDTLMFLAQRDWLAEGEYFFGSLVRFLAQILAMDYVSIDRLEGNGLSARSLAIFCDGKDEDPLTYALKDTLFGDMADRTICCHPRGVRQLFPQDRLLKKLAAECYIGITLWSSSGQPMGRMAVIGRRSLENPQLAETILKLVAVRVSGELERSDVEAQRESVIDALQKTSQELESRVKERTAALERSNRQLEEKITELVETQEALQEAHRFNQEIIKGAGVGILAYDRQYNYVLWNPFMENLTGIRAEEVMGKKSLTLFPFLQEQGIDRLLERAIAGETVVSPDVRYFVPQTGKSGWISGTYAPRHDGGGNIIGVIGTVRNITERKQAEDDIRSNVARAETLVRTAAIFTVQEDLGSMLQIVCQEAARVLNVPASQIYLYDEGLDEFTLAASFGFPPDFAQDLQPLARQLLDQIAALQGEGRMGVFKISQELLELPNTGFYFGVGVRVAMAVKIIHNQKLVGLLSVFSFEETVAFDQNEQALLLGLADQVAQAVVNMRLFEQVSAGRHRMRVLTQALIEIQETERRKLALELHDELGQVLIGIKIALDMIPNLPQAEVGGQLQRASALIGDLLNRVRRMALDLRPSMLDDMGLLPALHWLFKNYQAQSGEAVSFKHAGLERRFPMHVEITAYRIIQEALTNVLRHAGNKQVFVHTWADDQSLNLQILDHGVGFDPAAALSKGESSGLSGMRERARLLGGELIIESSAGSGTRLTAALPLVNHQES